ncbi:Wzz/FepE/Etk N-terminal domain-containing protein [Thiovibrio sp. JS02]
MDQQTENFHPEQGRRPHCDDEIDLMDLVDVVVRKKMLVVFITSFVTLVALGYSLFSPDRYWVEMTVTPVSERVLQQINVNVDSKFKFSSDEVFKLFLDTFQGLKNSPDAKERLGALTPEEIGMLGGISFELPGKRDPAGVVKLVMVGQDPKALSQVLSKYVDAANRLTAEKIGGQLALLRNTEMARLSAEIEEDKTNLLYWQQVRLQNMRDALLVARRAGIKTMPDVLPEKYQLFMLGEKILLAEVQSLQEKIQKGDIVATTVLDDGDALFLQGGILKKQLRLKSLQNAKYEPTIAPLVDAENASSQSRSLKPSTAKVVLLAFVVAFLCSIFAVFVVSFFESLALRKNDACKQ